MGRQELGFFDRIIRPFHREKALSVPPPITEIVPLPVGPSESPLTKPDSKTISKITDYLDSDIKSFLDNDSGETEMACQLLQHPFLRGINSSEIQRVIQKNSLNSFATAEALAKLIPNPDRRLIHKSIETRAYEARKDQEENNNHVQNKKRKSLPKPPQKGPCTTEVPAKPEIKRDVVWSLTGKVVNQEELFELIKKSGIPNPERTLETIDIMKKMKETDIVQLLQHYGSNKNVQHQRHGLAREMAGMHQFRIAGEWRLYWRIEDLKNNKDQPLVVVVGAKDFFGFHDSKDGSRSL